MKIEKKSVTDTGGGKYTNMQYSQEEELLTALLQNRMVGDTKVIRKFPQQIHTLSGKIKKKTNHAGG